MRKHIRTGAVDPVRPVYPGAPLDAVVRGAGFGRGADAVVCRDVKVRTGYGRGFGFRILRRRKG